MVKHTQKYWQRQYRKKGDWTYIQIRIQRSERDKLKDLCYQMKMTMQEFLVKMLMSKLPKEPLKEIPDWVEEATDIMVIKSENNT